MSAPLVFSGPDASSQALAAIVSHARAAVARDEDAFVVIDQHFLRKKLRRWRRLFPRIAPYYAVKCNPHPAILAGLLQAEETLGFDCASEGEIRSVLEAGAAPERVLYAHPVKPAAELAFALRRGVYGMTLDSVSELRKIRRVAEEVLGPEERQRLRLVLRLRVPDGQAMCPLGAKFGAALGRFAPGAAATGAEAWEESDSDAATILEAAAREGFPIRGLSFHVGSGCSDPGAYAVALAIARDIAGYVEDQGLPALELIDIGGGFPGLDGSEVPLEPLADAASFTFDVAEAFSWRDRGCHEKNVDGACGSTPIVTTADVATVVHASLNAGFQGSLGDLELIAEPGRFFVAGCQTICCEIFEVRRRKVSDHGDDVFADVFIAEGVHGAFKDAVLVREAYVPRVVPGLHGDVPAPANPELRHVCIRGPSGRPIDVVCPRVVLPEVRPGQWLAFVRAGAYTTAIASELASSARRGEALVMDYS